MQRRPGNILIIEAPEGKMLLVVAHRQVSIFFPPTNRILPPKRRLALEKRFRINPIPLALCVRYWVINERVGKVMSAVHDRES
jgi:hypothetical protein